MFWMSLVMLFLQQLGGNTGDEMRSVIAASDNSMVVAGTIWVEEGLDDQPKWSHQDVYVAKLDNTSGTTVWEKGYGWVGNDRGHVVRELSTGELMVLGETNSTGNGGMDAYLLQLDAQGELIWEQEYGGAQNERTEDAIRVKNNDVIVVGASASYGGSPQGVPWAFRVNSAGQLQWSTTYDTENSGVFRGIASTRDGFVLVGDKRLVPPCMDPGYTEQHFYAVKINGDGTVVWETTHMIGYNLEAHDVARMSDGGFVIAGSTQPNPYDSRQGMLLGMNANGKVIWHKLYGGELHDGFTALVRLPGNRLLMTGMTYSYAYNSDNAEIWLHAVAGTGKSYMNYVVGTLSQSETGRSLRLLPDGSFVCAGGPFLTRLNFSSFIP